jgi:tetratricopeptide (TPR) repeat protein
LYPIAEEYRLQENDIAEIKKSIAGNSMQKSIENARQMVLSNQISKAIYAYSQLLQKEPNNPVALEEYAYVLALSGFADGALLHLDNRWKSLPTANSYFYASQIFALMGYEDAAKKMVKDSIPAWIAEQYADFVLKYKRTPHFYGHDSISLPGANNLVEQGNHFKALVCFEQLAQAYPDAYIIRAGYGFAWEKAGFPELAAEELKKSINGIPDDAKHANIKKHFTEHATALTRDTVKAETAPPAPANPNSTLVKINKLNPQMMLYAGGIITKDVISLNSRFGVYVSDKFSSSLNMGFSGGFQGGTAFNFGISGYYRIKKIFLAGLGVNDMLSSGTNTFGINPSFGISLMDASRKSSWDIFVDLSIPFAAGNSPMFGISIGKSFYFGGKKLL